MVTLESLVGEQEFELLIGFAIAILAGFLIGAERERRGKPAGISTHALVIAGAMIFSFLSHEVDPFSKSRIASYVVAGIGFLGGGMIIKSSARDVYNLTTAASIWMAAAIGMAIGYQYYFLAGVAIVFNLLVPRIPKFKPKADGSGGKKKKESQNDDDKVSAEE